MMDFLIQKVYAYAPGENPTSGGGTAFNDLLQKILTNVVNPIIYLIMALAVVYFVWGVISYVISSDEEAKKAGKNRMIWGIIGLVVIVGMWGLVGIVTKTRIQY